MTEDYNQDWIDSPRRGKYLDDKYRKVFPDFDILVFICYTLERIHGEFPYLGNEISYHRISELYPDDVPVLKQAVKMLLPYREWMSINLKIRRKDVYEMIYKVLKI